MAGYAAVDSTRQRFTSKERDQESGLDYFGARYYSAAQGRFTSADEFTGGPNELFDFADAASDNPTFYADISKPQSLNKYQYAYNNPLRYIDPDGHDPEAEADPGDDKLTKAAKGAAIGAGVGAIVGAGIGAVVGGAGGGAVGTAVAPGAGTIAGAGVGGGVGLVVGAKVGAGFGAAIGALIGGTIGWITGEDTAQPTVDVEVTFAPPAQEQTQPQATTQQPQSPAQPMPPPPPTEARRSKGKEKRGGKEHTKGVRPSKRDPHQKGRTRVKKDKGGEKGDARRPFRRGGKKAGAVPMEDNNL